MPHKGLQSLARPKKNVKGFLRRKEAEKGCTRLFKVHGAL
jgi:hypothetical protein